MPAYTTFVGLFLWVMHQCKRVSSGTIVAHCCFFTFSWIIFFSCPLWGNLKKEIWLSSARIAGGSSVGVKVHSFSLALSLQVILSELYSTGFQRSFSDDDDLTAIADSDVIYAFQAPPLYSRGGSAPHSGNRGNRMSIKISDDIDFPHSFGSFFLISNFLFSTLPLSSWLTFIHTDSHFWAFTVCFINCIFHMQTF